MKKFAALLLAGVALLSTFASCGKKDETVTDGGIVVVNNGDRIYKEGQENPKTLKISFTEAGYGREWLVETSKEFIKANPEYEIKLYGDPALAGAVASKLESGKNLSDIFMPLNSDWQSYAYRGWLEPLDDVYTSKAGEETQTIDDKMDDVYSEYATVTTTEGTHKYVMPWNDGVTGIAYNVNMFKEYGWQVPETTAQLKTLCDQILADTDGEVKPFAYPGKIGGYFDYIAATWWMQYSGLEGYKSFFKFESADVYDPDMQPAEGKLKAMQEFFKFYDVNNGYSVSGSMSKDHTTSQMDFVRGEAAMIVNGNWLECEMRTNLPDGFTMGFMSVPFIEGAQKDNEGNYIKVNYVTPPDYMFIPKEAKEIEGAKKFLTFMCSDEMLEIYTKKTGSVRPFTYEVSNVSELSVFTQHVLEIKQTSVNYFDNSTSPLYMSGKAQKYIGGQPFAGIARGDIDPERFCLAEFVEADEKWDEWKSSSIE